MGVLPLLRSQADSFGKDMSTLSHKTDQDAAATIAVFQWKESLPPLLPRGDPRRISQDDGEESTYLAALPAATAVHAALQRAGYVSENAALSAGDLGWHIVASTAGRTYTLFVHWTGIEKADYLAIQPSVQRSWLAALFRSSLSPETLLPLKQMLSPALDKLPCVSDLRWLTEGEFTAAYCGGRPLPR